MYISTVRIGDPLVSGNLCTYRNSTKRVFGQPKSRDVHHFAALWTGLGRDAHELQLLGVQPERLRGEGSLLLQLALELRRNGHPVYLRPGDNEKAYRVDGRACLGRQHRALDAFLPPVAHERLEVGEVTELVLEYRRLGADGKRRAHLGDDNAYLAGRHLHPRELINLVKHPELTAQAGHEEFRLIPRFSLESD